MFVPALFLWEKHKVRQGTSCALFASDVFKFFPEVYKY
ncbi:hypothetical protein B4135_0385 [Caldibacillus debilis]|uniref:Uncharacterized protein n=1 Tax=Caldibacillus debilis TaxID=301148 RepID=A0A150LLF0_9BACI|nr:hypothetical protein B4135_0385 [Caldibacillus debilis]